MLKFNLILAIASLFIFYLAEAQRPIILKQVTNAPGKSGAAVTPAPAGTGVSGNLTFVITGVALPTTRKNAKPNSYVKVFSFTGGTSGGAKVTETELGTTAVINNNDSPKFDKVFWILWKKGTGQKLRISVKDKHSLGSDDDLGDAIVDLDQYVLEKNQKNTIPLSQDAKSKVKGGQILIEKTTPTSFRLYARSVPKKDPLGGKSDPYVEVFWRRGKTGTDIPLGTTEVKDDDENPDWNTTFEFANYQKGTDQWWFFKVQDKDNLSSDFIGELLVEVDPFVTKRQTKITKLEKSDGKCTLALTPA